MRAAAKEDLEAQRAQASQAYQADHTSEVARKSVVGDHAARSSSMCKKLECRKAVESFDMGIRVVFLPRTCRCLGLRSSGLCFHAAVTASPSLSLLLRIAAWGILQCATLVVAVQL